MNKFLNILSFNPSISIFLRKIVELNFRKQKYIIKEHFVVDEKNDRVLDLGCGTGEFALSFPAENYTGVDIDENSINYAKVHYPRKFLVADARKLPFDENSFSSILIIGVLHHLSDDDCSRVFKEIKRVLQPGGRLLVMEDIDAPDAGYLTHMMHRFDQGKFIRTVGEYYELLASHFTIMEDFSIRSGLCPYQVFLLKHDGQLNEDSQILRLEKINLQSFCDRPDGHLFIGEEKKNIPFAIKRFYFINQLSDPKAVRGMHAHKKLEQIILCINGSFDLHLDDGRRKWKIVMKDPAVGICLKSKVWHTMTNFSRDCVILVVANDYYDEKDYIRNYEEFLEYIKNN
jgi:SAM-dependent methyltransferase